MLKLANREDIPALKEFARSMMWAFPLIFMGLLPWLFDAAVPWWPVALSGVLMVLYVLYPPGLYYPYRVWMAIASVLGWINTRLVLGMAFYCLLMPMGLFMRSIGKLQYTTKHDSPANGKSYWIKRTDKLDKDNLENPFSCGNVYKIYGPF
jgi:hypothetical protein